jgi:hypothetical protein
MTARYAGVDDEGNPVRKGDEVLYWPSTRRMMTGTKAQEAWRRFLSEKGDEEGSPYARNPRRNVVLSSWSKSLVGREISVDGKTYVVGDVQLPEHGVTWNYGMALYQGGRHKADLVVHAVPGQTPSAAIYLRGSTSDNRPVRYGGYGGTMGIRRRSGGKPVSSEIDLADVIVKNPRLSKKRRTKLPASKFVFPKDRAWPIESAQGARDAIKYMKMGRVRNAGDFMAIRNFILKHYPVVWRESVMGMSWSKTAAAKMKGISHRRTSRKRTSRRAAN